MFVNATGSDGTVYILLSLFQSAVSHSGVPGIFQWGFGTERDWVAFKGKSEGGVLGEGVVSPSPPSRESGEHYKLPKWASCTKVFLRSRYSRRPLIALEIHHRHRFISFIFAGL